MLLNVEQVVARAVAHTLGTLPPVVSCMRRRHPGDGWSAAEAHHIYRLELFTVLRTIRSFKHRVQIRRADD